MALDVNFLESMTKLKAHPLNYIFKVFSHISNKRNSISLLEKLHWLPLGELVNVLPNASCLFWIPCPHPGRVYLVPPCESVHTYMYMCMCMYVYADIITKISCIDRIPFSIAMEALLLSY